jgi:hypothetical protein
MGSITFLCKESKDCVQESDWNVAATAFAAGFALDHSCKGLTLMRNSRGRPSYPYWFINFHLGPDKTATEWVGHQLNAFAAGKPIYIHYDPLGQFDWDLSRSLGGDNSKNMLSNDMEDSDASPKEAAHKVCTIIKGEGGTLR